MNSFFEKMSLENKDLKNEFQEIRNFLTTEFVQLDFEKDYIENKFADQFLKIRKDEIDTLPSPMIRYEKKIVPIIYEIFLEKIVNYLADYGNCAPIILNLKSKGFLPIEFVIELKNIKDLYEKSPEKLENLRKYIQIKDKIIQKFIENKTQIERLEDLDNPTDKLQLLYLIYRVVAFFHLQKIFNFSHIELFLKNNIKDWLVSIPLITLKNPDLYFCGTFLAKQLINLEKDINIEKVRKFLSNLYEESIDEFEVPIIEATDRVYYFFKSTEMVKLWLSNEQISKLLKINPNFFETYYLKNLETSQLVVILKIFKILENVVKLDKEKETAIIDEIEKRISPEGIKQFRDGFVSSEATYYVLFLNYMRNTLDKLKDLNLLEMVISRIYRNLEIIDFSSDTNLDLVSELFYSCECLKLFNCIETKQTIIHLAKYLFPQKVATTIMNSELLTQKKARFRHLKVNRITGDTIY